MKKRPLWDKRFRRGWRRTGYKEFGRKHPNPHRRFCGTCGNSFNIHNKSHYHSPAHTDYWGEESEEKSECAKCIEDYCNWNERNHCRNCMGLKPVSRHGKIRNPDIACQCGEFEPLTGGPLDNTETEPDDDCPDLDDPSDGEIDDNY